MDIFDSHILQSFIHFISTMVKLRTEHSFRSVVELMDSECFILAVLDKGTELIISIHLTTI